MTPLLSIIVAASENNIIGRNNDLPWSLPKDLKHFRRTTKGHPVIMGRKNYESIGHPLPKRPNIVVSRQQDLELDGATVVGSLEEAIELGKTLDEEEVFIIGGGVIYEQALPLVDKLYLTRVHTEIEGDVLFPVLNMEEWKEESAEEFAADEDHAYGFTVFVYRRR